MAASRATRRPQGARQSAPPKQAAARPAERPDLPERSWRIAAAAIFAVASFLRLYALGLKPLHHDEGVNGLFLVRLLHEGFYHYDPANYHGPTLYYLALLVARVNGLFHGDGLSDASVRVVTALFGIATVAMVLGLRKLLGKRGSLVAAALIAVSPGAVFYSRYFIHETLFVFFTLAVAVCAWLAWERSDPGFLVIGALAAAFLFATKETALVALLVLAIAAGTQRLWLRLREEHLTPAPPGPGVWQRLGGWPRGAIYAGLGAVVFVAVFVVFYSSFFTNPKGVSDALQSIGIWAKTGFTQAFYPHYAYLTWMAREEWPFLIVAAAGSALAVLKAPRGFACFAAIWAAGLFAAYTWLPYKEPWLALNFAIPAAISGGYGAARVWERARGTALHAVRVLGVALLAVLLYQTASLNFVHYDDNTEPYVYMHTTREVNDLMRDIRTVAARTGAGDKLAIAIVAPEYWPLPWYLRDYKGAGYWGRIVDTKAPVVIGSQAQEPELRERLGAAYRFVRSYDLRPGVRLVLFAGK
jgi:uncharacterized protein (TIGR03663 family)